MSTIARRRSARQAAEQRRAARDRRYEPTPRLSRYTLRGRRRRIRRAADLARGRYIDRADGSYLGGILVLVGLIVVDTLSTLFIIDRGGTEENPLMRSLLEQGTGWFLFVKLGALPLAFLLLSIARYFGWVRYALGTMLLVYSALATYHVYLLSTVLAQ